MIDRYAVNDTLTALANDAGVSLADGVLNDLTHTVADAIDAALTATPGLVTCDNCLATSESGWGDTPLCLDCQRAEDPDLVCEEHQRTFEDECPFEDHEPKNPCGLCGMREAAAGFTACSSCA